MKVKVNWEGLKLNGTHQLLVYVDDVHLLGEYIQVCTIRQHQKLPAAQPVALPCQWAVIVPLAAGL